MAAYMLQLHPQLASLVAYSRSLAFSSLLLNNCVIAIKIRLQRRADNSSSYIAGASSSLEGVPYHLQLAHHSVAAVSFNSQRNKTGTIVCMH